ncbi:hypothetical protein Cgig2_013632 [Carnegiea gigantea]|uniref:Uncharacterized protein n=1 Tax=Carnegiea gigantea TaxID=171969 RepID=A0A9Q1QFI4_9CARY|nr:hypothetical protein Cgig2_013632 [Carnegiea gigantea]
MSQSTEYTDPPEPEPPSKKQREQHHKDSLQPTTKRAPKTTVKKKVQFSHNEVEEPSTDKAGGDDNVRYCSTPDDPYYCSLEFLEQVDKLESMAIERMEQRTRMGCSPSSFNLGILPEREACATPLGDITPASFQPQMGVYTDPTGSVTASCSEQQLQQANENAINVQNTPEKGKELENPVGK